MRQAGAVIVAIYDATDLDFTTKFSLQDVGPIGNGDQTFYKCHPLVLVGKDRRVVGLTSQIQHVRSKTAIRTRPQETQSAGTALQRSQSREPTVDPRNGTDRPGTQGCQGHRCLRRAADAFENISHAFANGRSFVIRSTFDRILKVDAESNRRPRHLHQYARTVPGQERRTVTAQQSLARIGAMTSSVSRPH